MSTLTTNGAKTAPSSQPLYAVEEDVKHHGKGWIVFATVLFVIAAALNVIWGIAAVSNSTFFVGGAKFILSGLNTWGWIAIGWGALECLAAVSIWRGGGFGRWFGIFVAGCAAVLAMMTIPAYPFWSLTLFAVYMLAIYGLATYGGRPDLTK